MKKILLIDRSKEFLERVSKRLNELDEKIDTIYLKEHWPDHIPDLDEYKLVLIDLDEASVDQSSHQMLETLLAVKKENQKIVPVASDKNMQLIDWAFELGVDDFILKSNGIEDVINRIHEINFENRRELTTNGHITAFEPTTVFSHFELVEKSPEQILVKSSQELPLGAMISLNLDKNEKIFATVDSCKIIDDQIVSWLIPLCLGQKGR